MSEQTVANPPRATRVSQATSVEQTRAATEVQAAVVAARAVPRDVSLALAEMREATARPALAERAFFAFPRGREQVTGPTINLARELARIWGNIDYGVSELSRDDALGESEMRATAWDMQANARSSSTFIVKHAVDLKGGNRKDLTDLRDIYENNANNAARRVREMIFAVIPTWFVDEAKDRCAATLRDPGDGLTLAQRIGNLVERYAVNAGVHPEQLEARIGRTRDRWSDIDVAQLTVIAKSIARGELTVDEAFPRQTERVTAAALAGPTQPITPEVKTTPQQPAAAPDTPSTPTPETPAAAGPTVTTTPATVAGTDAVDDGPVGIKRSQLTRLSILAKELGYDSKGEGRQEYLDAINYLALRGDGNLVTSATELTEAEAKFVISGWQQRVDNAPKAPPEDTRPKPDGVDDRETRLVEYHLIVDHYIAAGWTEADAKTALEAHYALGVADLDLAQLQGFRERHAKTIEQKPSES